MEKEDKVKKGIWLSKKTLETCELGMSIDNSKYLNEYVENALKYYYANLVIEYNDDVIAEIFTKILNSKLGQSEDRISQLIFKIAVEEAKISNILAHFTELDEETITKLHKKCVEEIKNTNGNFNFEEIYKFQKRRS